MVVNMVVGISYVSLFIFIFIKLIEHKKIVDLKIDKEEFLKISTNESSYIFFIMSVQRNSSCIALARKLLRINKNILIVDFKDTENKYIDRPVLVKNKNNELSTYNIPRRMNEKILFDIYNFLEVTEKC